MDKWEDINNKIALILVICICICILFYSLLYVSAETYVAYDYSGYSWYVANDDDTLGDYINLADITKDFTVNLTQTDYDISTYSSSKIRDFVYEFVINTEFYQSNYSVDLSEYEFFQHHNYIVRYNESNGYFFIYIQNSDIYNYAESRLFSYNNSFRFNSWYYSYRANSLYSLNLSFTYQYLLILDSDMLPLSIESVTQDDDNDSIYMSYIIYKNSSNTSFSSVSLEWSFIDSYNLSFSFPSYEYAYYLGREIISLNDATGYSRNSWFSGSSLYYFVNFNSALDNLEWPYSGAELTEDDSDDSSSTDNSSQIAQDTYDYITDDNIDDTIDTANGFFNDFKDDDYGLSDIITMPLIFINSLNSGSCNSISIPLPFVDNNLILPCISDIMQLHFSSFLNIYQTVTFGIISYFICLDIYRMVRGFKDPDSDKIEVLDL